MSVLKDSTRVRIEHPLIGWMGVPCRSPRHRHRKLLKTAMVNSIQKQIRVTVARLLKFARLSRTRSTRRSTTMPSPALLPMSRHRTAPINVKHADLKDRGNACRTVTPKARSRDPANIKSGNLRLWHSATCVRKPAPPRSQRWMRFSMG